MLKLNKTQEKMVRQKQAGTFAIVGEAHSGKTSVAILRMLYLLEHACKASDRILYVCVNEVTKEQVSKQFNGYQALQNISLFDTETTGKASICSIDALIEEVAHKANRHLDVEIVDEISDEVIGAVLPQVKRTYPKVKWLKPEFVGFMKQELRWLNTCGYATYEQYARAPRKGASIKLPSKGSGRKAIWLLKELVHTVLKEQGLMMKSQMQMETLCYLQEDHLRERFKHIIIDDAHQLTKVQLECIRGLKNEEEGEVLFLLDKQEAAGPFAWLGSGQPFKSIGYDMTGRVKRFNKRKAQGAVKKHKPVEQTPLEQFMEEMLKAKQKMPLGGITSNEKSPLPWYVETYRYVNKITGVETIFQRDSSARETYIDEVKQDEVEALPVYSEIAAGMPIELVDENNGTFELPSAFLHHKRHTYILHVQGDSMIGANISDGDYVVIQAGNVNNHEIAAIYYNGTTTLKRIVQEEDKILLVSENPKYRPIVIEDGDFSVMGKLIGVIKPE